MALIKQRRDARSERKGKGRELKAEHVGSRKLLVVPSHQRKGSLVRQRYIDSIGTPNKEAYCQVGSIKRRTGIQIKELYLTGGMQVICGPMAYHTPPSLPSQGG